MLLSIITINKNNLAGLQSTVESVKKQTNSNFEYLLIDGASTDGSVDYIKNNTDLFTYWLSEPDKGIYDAMNKAILKSNGEYLLFLNSGDIFADDFVVENITPLIDREAMVILGRSILVGKDSVTISSPPIESLFRRLYYFGFHHQAALISKRLFKKYGLYNSKFRISSDWALFFEALVVNNEKFQGMNCLISKCDLFGVSSRPESQEVRKAERQEVIDRFVPKLIQDELAELSNLRFWKSEMMEGDFGMLHKIRSSKVRRFLIRIPLRFLSKYFYKKN